MREFSIIAVSLINLFILTRYIYLIIKSRIQPSLAMWVFFTLAVGMSLATYLKSGEFALSDNILNSADLVMVSMVALTILLKGDRVSRFNSFDLVLLLLVILIFIFWIFTMEHTISNILIQLILVIAYIPVIRRMLAARKNTEPFSVWIALMIAPVFSLISSQGELASVYAFRAIACTGLLLILMLRIELRNR